MTVLGGMVYIVVEIVEIVDKRLAVEVVAGIAAEVLHLSYVPWLQDWMWNYLPYSNVQVFDNYHMYRPLLDTLNDHGVDSHRSSMRW